MAVILPNPWIITAPLTSQMQGIVGVNRRITEASVALNFSGTLPTGFNSISEFLDFVKQKSRIALSLGGIPLAFYSWNQMADTRFIQRALRVAIDPDPTFFAGFAFVLESGDPSLPEFPVPPMNNYSLTFDVITFWNYRQILAEPPQKTKTANVKSSLGVKNPQGQPVVASAGGIAGDVSLTATGTALVAP